VDAGSIADPVVLDPVGGRRRLVDQLDLLGPIGVAFVLSALIGLERELRAKNAGLRTHTLVGVGAALFMVVSKYGFHDVLEPNRIVVDPSRVASLIVSGIGFIGAGLIFLRHDVVRGLTSAAIVWLTAAVGTAAGAGLWAVAVAAVVIHYVVTFAFPPIMRALPRSSLAPTIVHLTYRDGEGALRDILELATGRGFAVEDLDVNHEDGGSVQVTMEVRGKGNVHHLVAQLHDMDGVVAVRSSGTEGPVT
jgi:putative Mg2+ transporter-C (MgtC) family protein